tara:strand:+ start:670 stop:993 length:324 start_codon:yes stop_codon:yes gene_type:complete
MTIDGKKLQYASLKETDCNTSTQTLIPAIDGKTVVVCDIFVSAKKNAVDAEISLYDGSTEFFIWFPEYTSSSINLKAPIHLGAGNAFKIGCDSTTTDFSVLATYYYL